VIGLQETKVNDPDFPLEEVASMGYHVHYHGQKSHYGVAMLSRKAPVKVQKGFSGDDDDAQRRMIMGQFECKDGELIAILNGYFPQGENKAHETKFPAKRKFYADLMSYLKTSHTPSDRVAIMGDFNISPADQDIGIGDKNAKRWLQTGKCSFLPEEREWYKKLLAWGLQDSFRLQNPEVTDRYSWFDYRSKGFADEPKRGLRIDHILVTHPLAESLSDTGIDYESRAMEKPSDHCPIWSAFNI
jgi:exodeoxyribonuclease-3